LKPTSALHESPVRACTYLLAPGIVRRYVRPLRRGPGRRRYRN